MGLSYAKKFLEKESLLVILDVSPFPLYFLTVK